MSESPGPVATNGGWRLPWGGLGFGGLHLLGPAKQPTGGGLGYVHRVHKRRSAQSAGRKLACQWPIRPQAPFYHNRAQWVGHQQGSSSPAPGCIRREGASEAAPEAVRQVAGGGCQTGWGRLLSVANATEAGTCRQRDSAGQSGGGGVPPALPKHPWLCSGTQQFALAEQGPPDCRIPP